KVIHANARDTCMSHTVSELKLLSSAATNVPKEAMTFSNLARSAPPASVRYPTNEQAQILGSYPLCGPCRMRFPLKLQAPNAVYPACIMRNLTQPTIRSS